MGRGNQIRLCLVVLTGMLLLAGCDRAPAPASVGEQVVRDDVSIELERVSSTTPTDYMQPAPAGAMWITFRVENLRDVSLPIELALDQERPNIVASDGGTIQVNGMHATRLTSAHGPVLYPGGAMRVRYAIGPVAAADMPLKIAYTPSHLYEPVEFLVP